MATLHHSDACPPSYQDAVSSHHASWPDLVAPYVSVRDYTSLCLVNSRFYDVFCPLLWKDPLLTIRILGLDPGDGLSWYVRFIFKRAPRARAGVRSHVLSLDFRHFARTTYHFQTDSPIVASFKAVPNLFPNLRCILLDGYTELDVSCVLATPCIPENAGPSLVSLAGCQTLLSPRIFETDRLRHLTCLDVSGLSGSVRSLISSAHRLPRLRVLQVRGREMVARDAVDLLVAFARVLWSLDLSDNPLTDAVAVQFHECMRTVPSLRSRHRFEVEGSVDWPTRMGADSFGPFYHIQESALSGTFSHPDRYLADSPAYHLYGGHTEGSLEAARKNGRTTMVCDSLDTLKRALTNDLPPATADAVLSPSTSTGTVHLSHLHLSNTKLSTLGVETLIRHSRGHLESFDCDSSRIDIGIPWPNPWPRSTKLYGAPGSSYICRPVFSSNLRSLRLHHSLVTQVPTLEAEGLSCLARIWLAENDVRERCEMAYPQAFTPDANPRLTSLTLTRIPRRSSGPLVEKLTGFLKMLSIQERAIADATVSSSRRAPIMLRGLRRLSLEFEADPMEDPARFSSGELDAGELLDASIDEYSFFSEEADDRRAPVEPNASQYNHRAPSSRSHLSPRFETSDETLVLEGEHIIHNDKWEGRSTTSRVWVGSGTPGPHPAVNAYMELVRRAPLRRVVGAASPAQVRAGVPPAELIYVDAWEALLIPPRMGAPPPAEKLERIMGDVIESVKRYRAQTRWAYAEERERAREGGRHGPRLGTPHYFWTGEVEVVAKDSSAHYHASQYWR